MGETEVDANFLPLIYDILKRFLLLH